MKVIFIILSQTETLLVNWEGEKRSDCMCSKIHIWHLLIGLQIFGIQIEFSQCFRIHYLMPTVTLWGISYQSIQNERSAISLLSQGLKGMSQNRGLWDSGPAGVILQRELLRLYFANLKLSYLDLSVTAGTGSIPEMLEHIVTARSARLRLCSRCFYACSL